MPSSVIRHFSYDEQSEILKILFVTGLTYQYHKVPKKIFNMFKAAASKGRYFNNHIKDHYTFTKIGET